MYIHTSNLFGWCHASLLFVKKPKKVIFLWRASFSLGYYSGFNKSFSTSQMIDHRETSLTFYFSWHAARFVTISQTLNVQVANSSPCITYANKLQLFLQTWAATVATHAWTKLHTQIMS